MDYPWIVILLGAYGLGTLPGALIVCSIFGLPDPRTQGSKNPGSTNVARIGGKKAGALTFVIDTLKGFIPIVLANAYDLPAWQLGFIAFASGLGHCFPVWSPTRGGKGVATFFGALLAISWPNAILTGVVWALVTKLTRYVSLASLSAVVSATLISFWLGGGTVGLALFANLIFLRHKSNLIRLYQGTESRLPASRP